MNAYDGRRFEERYQCYPVSFREKEHLEDGDKILLPASALDTLARLSVEYPMLFEISNPSEGKKTHCGVCEFTAPEGRCFIPFWMMQNLLLEPGSYVNVINVSLPKATFVKIQPQSVDFLDITNHRAVLERQLRNFSCVTKGDHLCIPHNDRKYYLEIKEVKPSDAACIIETDCNVEFDAPVGYEEQSVKKRNGSLGQYKDGVSNKDIIPPVMSAKAVVSGDETDKQNFLPFTGKGARLDGKSVPQNSSGDAAKLRSEAAEKRLKSDSNGNEGFEQKVIPGVAPPRPVSRLGKKFSKTAHTEAFYGSGNKLG